MHRPIPAPLPRQAAAGPATLRAPRGEARRRVLVKQKTVTARRAQARTQLARPGSPPRNRPATARPGLNGRAGHLVAANAVIDLSELLRLDVSLRHGDQVFRLGVPAVAQTTPLSRLSCRWIRQGR